MAYTKAPVSDTHNVSRIPSRGTSFLVTEASSTTATSVSLSYLDCYPRVEKQFANEEKVRISKREGWQSIAVTSGNITTGASVSYSVVTGVGASANTTCWFNIGTNIYSLTGFNGTPVLAVEQTGVTNSSGSCTGTLAVDDSNVTKVCFLSGTSQLFTFNQDGTGNVTTDLSAIGVLGGGNLVFLNGYLFAVGPYGRIYNSVAGGDIVTWNNTDFLTPEIYPDACYWIDKHHNYLVAFSETSTEFFYDGAVEIGSPLTRQESYACRVGLASNSETLRTCKIGDDIYFLGRNLSDQVNLYRIRNFKVEPIEQPYFNAAFNWVSSASVYQKMSGVQSLIINNQPMVACVGPYGYEMIYSPEDDAWWCLRTDIDANKGLTSVNTDFPGYTKRLGSFASEGLGYRPATIIAYDSSTGDVTVRRPAVGSHPTVQADIYTDIIDFGINYLKHCARVDAVGDYGNNTLTLYYNNTPNYGQSYVECSPTKTPSSLGYKNNLSWYNIGPFRRMTLRLKISGTGEAFHEGFDMEYNAGAM